MTSKSKLSPQERLNIKLTFQILRHNLTMSTPQKVENIEMTKNIFSCQRFTIESVVGPRSSSKSS